MKLIVDKSLWRKMSALSKFLFRLGAFLVDLALSLSDLEIDSAEVVEDE